jgi:hypothetical protein
MNAALAAAIHLHPKGFNQININCTAVLHCAAGMAA